MNPLPSDVERRVAAQSGGQLALVYEPAYERATLYFQTPRQLPLNIIVHGVRDPSWPFAHFPELRVPFRFAAPVRAVHFATSRSFEDGASVQSVRVEVELVGAASIALEGENVTIGPVETPPPKPPNPAGWS